MGWEEHINDLPVLIHRTIQVEFSLTAKAKHFVHHPFPPDPPLVLADSGGHLRAKRWYPVQHRV